MRFIATHYRRPGRGRLVQPPFPPIQADYDRRLLALRVRLHLTQDGLAQRIGAASKAVIYQWESSIEAAAPFGWERYVGPEGAIIGISRFGASAPGPVLMREFGFTPEHVVETAKALLNRPVARLRHAAVDR